MKRQTIAKAITVSGTGVHTGVPARVTLKPAEQGFSLTRTDTRPQAFSINPASVQPSPLCTLLVNASGATLSTVEHLFSALHGLGITSLSIEVDGPEVPILDGSALPWVTALEDAGLAPLPGAADMLYVTHEAAIVEGERALRAIAADHFALDCSIAFPHPLIGSQRWQGSITPAVYKAEIAPARTFILQGELEQARAAGYARGASLSGGVLFNDNGTVENIEGLRFADEPVRHKVLDAIGDLFMAGKPVVGHFTLARPGHTSNNQLLRHITQC